MALLTAEMIREIEIVAELYKESVGSRRTQVTQTPPNPLDFTAPWLLAYHRDTKNPPVRITDLRQHPDGDWYTAMLHPVHKVWFNPDTGVTWDGEWTLRNASKPDPRLPLEAYNHSTGETVPITDCYRYDDEFWQTRQLSPDGETDYFSRETGVMNGESNWQLRNVILPTTVELTITMSTTAEGHIRLQAEGNDVRLASAGAFGSVERARQSIPGLAADWLRFYNARHEIREAVAADLAASTEPG